MEFNYGQIINDLISIFLLATVLLFLNNKAKEQADGKVGGIKANFFHPELVYLIFKPLNP